MKNLTPEYPFIPAKEKIISFFQSDVSTGSMITKTGNLNSSPNETSVGSGNNIFKITSGGIHLGAAAFSSAPFSVSMEGLLKATGAEISGNITATTGAIGGWTIAATALSNGNMSISSSTGINFNSVFTVNASGAMTATSGTIGGWTLGSTTISATSITLDSGNQRISVGATSPILIDGANKKIESSNYVSGYAGSGFHIDENLMEVGNIACRGLIRTSVFQKDVISTVGGNLMVLDGDVLATDMTAADNSTMTTKATTSFAVGDILRIKDGTNDEWFTVSNIASAPTYTVTRDSASAYGANANPTWKKGATIVNYGQSGDGGLYMTASESNAPYLSVFTHAGSPWDTITTRLRIGNLNGYLGYSTDLYGVAIGDSDNYLKYEPTNGLRIKGTIASGQTDYNTGTGFWLGDDSGTPKFSIGKAGESGFTWDGTQFNIKTDDLVVASATGKLWSNYVIPLGSSEANSGIGVFESSYEDINVRNRLRFIQTKDDETTEIHEKHQCIQQSGMIENISTTVQNTMLEITLPINTVSGGQIFYSFELVNTGNATICYAGTLNFSCGNLDGTYNSTIVDNGGALSKSNAGDSLSVAWAFVTGTDKITLKMTPTFSITTGGTSSYNMKYILMQHNNQLIKPIIGF